MPKKLRALPYLLFRSNRSKQLKRGSSERAELSQKPPSVFRMADAFTSVTLPAMSSLPCSRTESHRQPSPLIQVQVPSTLLMSPFKTHTDPASIPRTSDSCSFQAALEVRG